MASVPSCSPYSGSAYNEEAAAHFEPRKLSYYRGYWNKAVPGVVFGILSLICAIVFLTWLLSLLCRRTCWLSGKAHGNTRKHRWKVPYLATAVVGLLAVLACCFAIWGMAASIGLSTRRVDSVWSTVGDIDGTVSTMVGQARTALLRLDRLQNSLALVSNNLPGLAVAQQLSDLLNRVLNTESLQDQFRDLAAQVANIRSQGLAIVNSLQRDAVDNLREVEDKYRAKSEKGKGSRTFGLILLYGLTIVAVIVASALTLARQGPRTAASFTLILWIMIGLLFIVGAGFLNGARSVSQDSCLYMDPFAIRVIQERFPRDTRAAQAAAYYLGQGPDVNNTLILPTFFGVSTASVENYATSGQTKDLLAFLGTAAGQAAVELLPILNTTQKDAILGLPGTVQTSLADLALVQAGMDRRNFAPLVGRVRGLLCCDLARSVKGAFTASTVTAAFALLLAILLTGFVMRTVRKKSDSDFYGPYPGENNSENDKKQELASMTNPVAHRSNGDIEQARNGL